METLGQRGAHKHVRDRTHSCKFISPASRLSSASSAALHIRSAASCGPCTSSRESCWSSVARPSISHPSCTIYNGQGALSSRLFAKGEGQNRRKEGCPESLPRQLTSGDLATRALD
eukprot:1141330-Pelagomonas_calceolata.AAC.1